MTRPARVASLLTLAFVLTQLAWVLAVPPFRAIDEFDHAYRAAAVAGGQFLPSDTPVAQGRGDYVEVPRSIVEAANPVCTTYKYVGPDNCNPVTDTGDGYVRVASAAARYNPAFYWVVGKPAQLLEGTANVYALRLLASALCAGLFWVAAFSLALAFRTAWPLLGLAVAVTPVYVYSTSVGAPNGVEMTAGLALWCSLLAMRSDRLGQRGESFLLAAATGAAAVVAVPRLLGPGWMVLIVAAAAFLLGRDRLRETLATHRLLLLRGSAVVLAAVVSAVVWARVATPNSLAREEDLGLGNPVGGALGQVPGWILQSIAAFPTRNEAAPTAVYAAGALAILVLLGAAGWGTSRRWWALLGGLVAVWLGVQLTIVVATYSQLGDVWQGRYALPFAVGIPVAMAALRETTTARAPHRLLAPGLLGLVLLAHTVSVANVHLDESGTSPLAGSSSWVTVPTAVLVVLVLAAGALCRAAARAHLPATPEAPATPGTAQVAQVRGGARG